MGTMLVLTASTMKRPGWVDLGGW